MSFRSVLPIFIIMLLLLPGLLDLSAAPAKDHGLTVKWTRNYQENLTYTAWLDDQVQVYSTLNSSTSCNAIQRTLDSTTGNETSYWRHSCDTDLWLEDIDGDGRNEGIVANQFWLPHDIYKLAIYRYGQSVPYVTYTSAKPKEYIYPSFGVGDVNGNGYEDIAIERYMLDEKLPDPSGRNRVFHDKRFEVRDGMDMSLIWGLDLDSLTCNCSEGVGWGSPIFDGNSDGIGDQLLFFSQPGSDTTYVQTGRLYDGKTGKLLWSTSTDWAVRGTYLQDVDEDKKAEMVIFWVNNSVWGSPHTRFEIRKPDGSPVKHPVLGFNTIPGEGDLVDLGKGHGLVYFTANKTDTTHMRFEVRDFLSWKLLFSEVLEGKDEWFPRIEAAHDYNSDGVPELLIVGYKDHLIDGKTFKVLWSGPYDSYDRAFASPFIGIYEYTRTPYFQFPEIAKGITIQDYGNGSVIWEGPENGTFVFGDIEDMNHDKDVEFLLAVRNNPANGTVTMYGIPKALANTPANPIDNPRFTTVTQCTGPLLAFILLLTIVAMTALRRMTKGNRP